MSILPGYKIREVLHENNRVIVYSANTLDDEMPVVIKALKKEAVNPLEIALLMHEYEIIRSIDNDDIVKPLKFEQSGSFFALISKDTDSVTLRKHMNIHGIGLNDFLEIAIRLTEILGQLHQKNIIHRDLKPENILIHPKTGEIHIIDFSSAIQFSPGNSKLSFKSSPIRTPEYMAPEMTGRLKIGADKRSDLYSLGVIFYEMLTGQLPFHASDFAEWVYVHLTCKPEPPESVNAAVPSAVSEIIMKLLNKDPDERYQSTHGLLWDLKECRKQLSETGRIELFQVGRMDNLARFRISGKFYGRKKEIKELMSAFRRVCEGSAEVVLISGESGIGKTMLVTECLNSMIFRKGFFITGKADQLKRNIPYALFVSAFSNLVKQLMTEDNNRLIWWKNKILHSLGRNCAVIAEIIPELELITGKQPPAEALPPQELENRFMTIIRDFIKIFVWKNHPMVLFLDDLQWADRASIKLLKLLVQDADLHYLLILGAFRDNELEEGTLFHEITLEAQRQEKKYN